MEFLVGGLILLQGYTQYMHSKDRKALLNAAMAKTPQEFIKMQATPKRKVRVEPVQDDAGIPFGI